MQKIYIQIRLWLISLLWIWPGFVHAESALDNFMRDLQTLQATFVQVLYDETGAEMERSTGTLSIQRPGKFRWEYQSPYHQLIVADAEQVWIYDEDLAQVTLKPYHETLKNTPALLLTSGHKLEELYEVEAQTTDNGQRYRLTPKQEQAQFRYVSLEFVEQNLVSLTLHDNLDQMTQINLTNAKRNQPINAEQFIFTPPAGVDLIDGYEQ